MEKPEQTEQHGSEAGYLDMLVPREWWTRSALWSFLRAHLGRVILSTHKISRRSSYVTAVRAKAQDREHLTCFFLHVLQCATAGNQTRPAAEDPEHSSLY